MQMRQSDVISAPSRPHNCIPPPELTTHRRVPKVFFNELRHLQMECLCVIFLVLKGKVYSISYCQISHKLPVIMIICTAFARKTFFRKGLLFLLKDLVELSEQTKANFWTGLFEPAGTTQVCPMFYSRRTNLLEHCGPLRLCGVIIDGHKATVIYYRSCSSITNCIPYVLLMHL